jgi:hypothetical protein
MELQQSSQGHRIYLAYQRQKETLAQQYEPGGAESRIRGLLPS